MLHSRKVGGTSKQSHGDGEELVIDHTRVHGEHGHQQDAVPTTKKHRGDIIQLRKLSRRYEAQSKIQEL
jgi:hypothetical protein